MNNDNYKLLIRTNGKGNAWPILLGSEIEPTTAISYADLANTSLSIIKSTSDIPNVQTTKWDILIDGGHGIVQYYIINFNRIPDAFIITHPHHDHTYSIDWIVQSYHRKHNKLRQYPVYATKRCWKVVLETYPQIEQLVSFTELEYGKPTHISEADDLHITAFPVHHGTAAGATMLFAHIQNKRILFTGDLLCPLLRKQDYEQLMNVDVVYVDSNNRFPYPKTNHWSICDGKHANKTNYTTAWLESITMDQIMNYHTLQNHTEYLQTIMQENPSVNCLYNTQFDFFRHIQPKKVNLVHYSGAQDIQFHSDTKLNEAELANWCNTEKNNYDLSHIKFAVPKTNSIEIL